MVAVHNIFPKMYSLFYSVFLFGSDLFSILSHKSGNLFVIVSPEVNPFKQGSFAQSHGRFSNAFLCTLQIIHHLTLLLNHRKRAVRKCISYSIIDSIHVSHILPFKKEDHLTSLDFFFLQKRVVNQHVLLERLIVEITLPFYDYQAYEPDFHSRLMNDPE